MSNKISWVIPVLLIAIFCALWNIGIKLDELHELLQLRTAQVSFDLEEVKEALRN